MGQVLEMSVNNFKFYELYEDRNGDYVNGHDIRPFLDWLPSTPDRPRWAKLTGGGVITYRNSELKPVVDSEY